MVPSDNHSQLVTWECRRVPQPTWFAEHRAPSKLPRALREGRAGGGWAERKRKNFQPESPFSDHLPGFPIRSPNLRGPGREQAAGLQPEGGQS